MTLMPYERYADQISLHTDAVWSGPSLPYMITESMDTVGYTE